MLPDGEKRSNRKTALDVMGKAKRLPRLALMGFIPIMISQIIPMPLPISWTLATWGCLFLSFFWMEGLMLSYRIIHDIEINAKTYNIIKHLDDIEAE